MYNTKELSTSMKLKKRIIVACLLFFCINNIRLAQGQSQSSQPFSSTYEVQKIPANPDVAQLGKFGDIPVNKYNGTANISIPIYEIDLDGLKIPLALKYNTSGIRVEQEASWVGLGWSLSDGITITREVNGYEDIYNANDANARSVGWIFNRDYLSPNPEDSYSAPGELSEMDLIDLQRKKTTDYKVDLEPDLFTVNLPSGSCKFTLPKIVGTQTILTAIIADNKNFKVLYNITGKEFKVTDPNGYTFDFTITEMSTGYGSYESIDNYSKKGVVAGIRFPIFQGKQMISSWRVSKITSPYGRQLNFTYQNGFYFSFPHFTESQEILAGNYPTFMTALNVPIYLSQTPEPSANMSGNLTAFYVKNLTSISGDFGSVEFVLSDRSDLVSKQDKLALSGFNPLTEPWNTYLDFGDALIAKKVDQVVVKNKKAEVVKTANLSYSYFNSQWVGVESASVWNSADPFQCDVSYIRLKLDRVDIDDQKYLFEYEQPNSLPAKYSRSVDFWGFYNGINNSTKIPSFNRFYANHPGLTLNDEWHEFFLKVNGGNRSADATFGKIGALQKLTYPTGGYTIFSYEGHKVTMSNITYRPIQYCSNGQVRFTNLNSSSDYNYSYQYLKLAKTPSYSLYNYQACYNASTTYQPNTIFQITQSPTCLNVKVNATFTCQSGCTQSATSGRAVWITNVNTGQEYNIFSHEGVTSRTQEKSLSLPLGTYQLNTSSWVQTTPPTIMVMVSASLIVGYDDSGLPPAIPLVAEEFEVGGLRVKSVTNYSADGSQISKSSYVYDQFVTENAQQVSNAKLMDDLVFHSKAQSLFDYSAIDFNQNSGGAGAILSSDNKIRTSPSAGGSHIGYTLVREQRVDGSGNSLGQTVTEFNNRANTYVWKPTEYLPRITSGVIGIEDFHTSIFDLSGLGIIYYPVSYGSVYVLGARPITYEYSNGTVLKDRTYDQANNLIRETTNAYAATQILTYPNGTLGTAAGENPFVYFFGNGILHFQPYQKVQASQINVNIAQQLISTTTTEFLNGNQSITATNDFYENPDHYLLTRRSATASDGKLRTTKYYYPKDLPGIPFMNDLASANRQTSPVITEVYVGDVTNPYSKLIEKTQTLYSNTNSTTGDILPSQVLTYTLGSAVGQQRVLYEKYSNFGTLIQYRKSAENVPVSLLWGHSMNISDTSDPPFRERFDPGISEMV